MRRYVPVTMVLVAALSVACATDTDDLTQPIAAQMCLPETCGGGGGGNPPTDPAPTRPGIWIGADMGLSRCYSPTGAGINDVDLDRFDDWCEQWIAYQFRPLLATNPGDCDLRREPAWGVKYFPSSGVIRVGYFLSYYNDCGNMHSDVCDLSLPGTGECVGHDGDSEFILMDLSYNSGWDHYLLERVFTSAHYLQGHWFFGGDKSSVYPHTRFTYRGRPRGHPLVWVALGKHANYFSQQFCNDGAIFDTDTCVGNTVETRLEFVFSRNIGSPAVHGLDCTPATPAMQWFRAGVECYWDGYDSRQQPPAEKFFGWWDPGSNPYAGGAMPYGPIIRVLFEPATLPCLLNTWEVFLCLP